MTKITIGSEGEHLVVLTNPMLTSGDRGTAKVELKLDETWKDYTISTVFFTDKDETAYEVVNSVTSNEYIIPTEVLADAGLLFIGVRGTNGENIRTSNIIAYKVVKGTPVGNGSSVDPTPSQYEQLMANYTEVLDIMNTQNERITNQDDKLDQAIASQNETISTKLEDIKKYCSNWDKITEIHSESLPVHETSTIAELDPGTYMVNFITDKSFDGFDLTLSCGDTMIGVYYSSYGTDFVTGVNIFTVSDQPSCFQMKAVGYSGNVVVINSLTIYKINVNDITENIDDMVEMRAEVASMFNDQIPDIYKKLETYKSDTDSKVDILNDRLVKVETGETATDVDVINLVPKVSNYICDDGTVIYSGEFFDRKAWHLFDNDENSIWSGGNNDSNGEQYVGFEFNDDKFITDISFLYSCDNANFYFKPQAKINNKWIDLDGCYTCINDKTKKTYTLETINKVTNAIRILFINSPSPLASTNYGFNGIALTINGTNEKDTVTFLKSNLGNIKIGKGLYIENGVLNVSVGADTSIN